MSRRKKSYTHKHMENISKISSVSPQKVKNDLRNKATQDFITKLEKCLLQYRKQIHLRTVLRLGKYIKGNTFHIKILQLGKVRQYKNMVSFYQNKLSTANKTKTAMSNKPEITEISVNSRLATLRNRRKTLEDKEKQQQWDIERLEEQARMEPCTSRAAIAKDEQAKQSFATSTLLAAPIPLPRSKSFFDKLLLKINRSNSAEDITKESNKDDESSSCSSSTGFLGFHENDQVNFNCTKPSDKLSDNLENKSAFFSEELEVFLKENALENCSNITIPTVKFEYEEGMVHSGSEMPTMDVPKQLVKRKARTVAEKRQILESKKDVKFLMVENESTIYWELQRRLKKSKTFSYNIISMIQEQDIPIRRGVWKTAAWLATHSGKFYFQSIEVEDDIKNYRINLYGGHGNFDSKLLHLKKPKFKRYNSGFGCNMGCNILKSYPNLNIDLPAIREKLYKSKGAKPQELNRLNLISNKRNLKPGPLSSKLKYDGSGELEIFEMPQIQLELNPRVGYEFAKDIQKYLNIILPSERITEEWAKFAVSAVVEPFPPKKGGKPKSKVKQTSYTFDIPYADNQIKVLTRKELVKRIYTPPAIYTSGVKKEMDMLEKPLSILPKCIDRNDPVQCEIGDYLKDMFNSAVIGLCQNSIVKNDPDLNYNQKDGVQSQLKGKRINNFHDKKVRKNKSKLLNELRRLNATFIETSDTSENHDCNEEHCTLGCVCTDIRKIPPIHCRREKCMFECTCKKLEERAYIKRNAIVEDGLSEEDMKLLRDRATCRLAKMEKDFSSTIVLTNDNTILIHNTQVESKRNRKPSKILKGYSTDDLDKDEEKPVIAPRATPEKEIIAINVNKYKSIEYMTHCNVVLDKLPALDGLEVWCMVHCLYKCFCNGTATKGDVFGFNDVSAKNSQHFPPAPAKRRNYTFEKPDAVQTPTTSKSSSFGVTRESSTGLSLKPPTTGPAKPATTGSIKPPTSGSMKPPTTGPRSSKTSNKVVAESEEPLLSRLEVVNYDYYRMKNKAVRRKILKHANAEAKLHSLLKQRVNDCLYSKRLNQSKKSNNVVIILSESEDEKDDEVEEISTNTTLKEDEINDKIQTVDLIKDGVCDKKDSSEDGSLDKTVTPVEDLHNEQNIRATTPEPDLSKYSVAEPNVSYSPFSNRVPVDRFIEFSQQIENGTIKSPNNLNTPLKSENVTKLNLIVTKAMSKLCEMQKNNLNDIPDPKPKGFNNISWNNLIKIYQENKIFVWEVRRVTKSSNLNLLLAITKTCTMPKIENAVSVLCIKAVKPDELSVTGKMINLQIMNEKTKNLAVIIYGQLDHWLILGCIHSDVNYLEDGVCVRPTPSTHPLLATKINKLNTLLCTNPFILQNRNTKTTPILPFKLPETSVANSEISNMAPMHKSNIEIVSFSSNDTNSLFLPIPVIGDHRWFMLTIEHDFSDIYIPTWHSFLKYERIVATHKIARSRSKTVRILHMNNEHTVPHVFITPKESNKIFFGPYRVDQDVSMVLCQECDGKMLSREIYEEQTKINRGRRTTGCWLYVKNNEIVPGKTQNNMTLKSVKNSNEDNDVIFLDEVDTLNNKNDCILIEDDDDDQIDPPLQSTLPPVKDGKKVILRARTPPLDQFALENKVLMKSVSDEKESTSDSNAVLAINDKEYSTNTTSTKDMSKFSLIPGTRRSKVFSILKPVTTKTSGSSVEIVFNQLKPGQTTAMAVAANSTKPTSTSQPTELKQVSLLKNHVGKFLKLKPISQLSTSSKDKSLSPPPVSLPIVPTDNSQSTQSSSPQHQSSTVEPSVSTTPPSSTQADQPTQLTSKQPKLLSPPLLPQSPISESTKPLLSTRPRSLTNLISAAKSPPLSQSIPQTESSLSTKLKRANKSPTRQSTSPTQSLVSSAQPRFTPLKPDNSDIGDTLVIIDNEKVVTKSAPAAARLINRRKTMDGNTMLNRFVYNSGTNLNTMLRKRKSNEYSDAMKKPLLNANLKVFKKQSSDIASPGGIASQEQIKILLKRKKSTQNDDSRVTKIRIVEDLKPRTEISSDAVTKAIKKLSSTSTYIRNHVTSTVTSSTVSTSVSATVSPTTTSSVQMTSMVTTTNSNTNLHSRLSLDNNQSDNKVLNLTDTMKLKDPIVVASSEENDPRLNIKAYIISECVSLGKIPCVVNKLNITFQLPTMENPVTLSGLSSLNQFLHKKIGETLHSIIPSDLNLKWSIMSDRKKMKDISDLSPDMFNKHKILTQYGLIDIRDNLDNNSMLKANPGLMVKLLILQLDCLLNENMDGPIAFILHKNSAFQILQKTQAYVKQLKSEEARFMKIKLNLYKEIYHKNNQLSKLTEMEEIITPDTNPLPPPIIPGPSKRLFLQYGNKNSNNAKKNSVSNHISATTTAKIDVVTPSETIVIDDDDD